MMMMIVIISSIITSIISISISIMCIHITIAANWLRQISLLRLSLLRYSWLNTSGEFPTDMRIPTLEIKIQLESNLWNPES